MSLVADEVQHDDRILRSVSFSGSGRPLFHGIAHVGCLVHQDETGVGHGRSPGLGRLLIWLRCEHVSEDRDRLIANTEHLIPRLFIGTDVGSSRIPYPEGAAGKVIGQRP